VPAVQAAGNSIFPEISTGRNHFNFQAFRALSIHFAEVRGLTGANQELLASPMLVAHDLDLEIPAACRADGIVGSPAACGSAGILVEHCELTAGGGGLRQDSIGHHAVLNQAEAFTPQLSGLRPGRRDFYSSGMSPGAAPVPRRGCLEKFAGHVERNRGEQIFPMTPQPVKGDSLGVTEKPGCLVVAVPWVIKIGTHPERQIQSLTLRTKPTAGRRRIGHLGR
jgi:hypothetical protein